MGIGKNCIMFFAVVAVAAGIPCTSHATKFKLADIDWDLTGSLRLDTGYRFSNLGSTPVTPAGQESSQTDWFIQIPDNTRLGLRATYQKLSAYYEIGFYTRNNPSPNASNASLENTLKTRYLYGTYSFNDSNTILLGQTVSVLAPLDPEQHLNNDQLMKGFGNLYPGRNPQIRYTYRKGNLSADVAVEDTINACSSTIVSGSHIFDNYVPVIEASLTYKNDKLMLMPSAYFQTYTLKKNDDVSTTQTVDVTSWAAALDGTLNAGFILLAMEIWYGQNLSSYGIDFRSSGTKESTTMGAPVANAQGNDLKNVNSAGGWFQIGIPIKPVTIYAGYGYQQSQVKRTNSATIAYNSNISTQGVYANVKWAVTKGFYIQPEVVYFDNGNDAQKTLTNPSGSVYSAGDNNLGGDIWAGIHFQYDF